MIFSLRQLQEKCREQRRPPVHRFYRPDQRVRPGQQVRSIHTPAQNRMPPPKLLRMITSFHEEMKGTVQYDGSSPSKVASNKGASSRRHFLASCSPCCYVMPSANPKRESTCTPEAMVACSTWHTSVPRQRCAKSSFGRCSSLMTPPSQLTPKLPSRSSLTALPVPVHSLASRSVSKRLTSWAKMLAPLPASP